jgi:L-alanine-DL-glutamate epimerase-like enolase superfamily enzyme
VTDHTIASVEGIIVGAAQSTASVEDDNPSNEVLLVILRTESGLTGLGECNHHPFAARAFLTHQGQFRTSRGVASSLVGRDPRDRATLEAELYQGNFFAARRGIGWAVLAAIDTALWDLIAQIRDVPLWQLLWPAGAHDPLAYHTLYTGAADWSESRRRLADFCARVTPLGYPGMKLEPLIDCVPEELIGDFVLEGRELLGPDVELLVDLGYRMPDSARALRAAEACLPARPIAIETPCHIDAFRAWRETAAASPIPIAGAELLEHPEDLQQLIDAGVQIIQPWPVRVGISGTMDVIERARRASRRILLGGWNATSIGVAAGIHIAAGIARDEIVLEHAARSLYGFPLRDIAGPEPEPVRGRFKLPTEPGLGIRPDWNAIARLRIA